MLFCLLSLVGYCGLLIIVGESGIPLFTKNLAYKIGSPGFMHTRIREIKKSRNIDVLFIGSSETYRGFDVRIFRDSGYTCFNLGSSAQTPLQTELLLNRYVDSLNPGIIVFEASPASFMNDGVESELDLIANDKVDIGTLKNSFKLKNLKVYNTIFYALYRELTGRDKDFKEAQEAGTSKYIPGGFVERKMRKISPADLIPENRIEFRPIGYQENAFRNIVELAKRKEKTLFIVQAPVCKVERERYSNYYAADSFFGVAGRYINFNNLSFDDTVHFSDKVHLNQVGVKKFSNAVITELLRK